ncbi:hypothetical protein QYE76_050751 [Lolium multiflorum]|uniref:DDE Tnp4 domain-containing protein n=1 Tax=Lolium multiflorum TaxID=4521 RepID=A0AAD8SQM0_LOLMU|nr:hypothetical protein QYE76_050751 [Lolium multiflorum]
MENLTHVGSVLDQSTNNNMADDTGGCTSNSEWKGYLVPEVFLESGPVVEAGKYDVLQEGMWNSFGLEVQEGLWNNFVVEGMNKNGVVEGMGKKGAESMVGAAGSTSQFLSSGLGEQGPASSGNFSEFEFHVWEPPLVIQAGNNMGAEWNAGRALSGSKEAAGGGSNEDNTLLDSQMVESVAAVEAPHALGMVNLGNKRGAEWMGVAPPGARGSKRQRTPSGSIGTSGGSNHESMGSEALFKFAALADVRRRETVWWDEVSRPGYPDVDFKRHFHMSRSTFDKLCKMLDRSVRKEDTPARDAIPVPQRVALCVYRFATGESFSGLHRRFGFANSTINKIMQDVTEAMNAIVEPEYLTAMWPRGTDAMDDAAAKFQALTVTGGLPGVIGAVYTTHVPIKAPKPNDGDHASLYHCSRRLTERRNGNIFFSVALHAAVDADGTFTGLYLGRGIMSDEEIFSVSPMSTEHAEEMISQHKRLVGGAGYPLTDCTLVPYTHSDLTPAQTNYNDKVALARGVALDAFRRLKARWAILQKRSEVKLEAFKSQMRACCVLHNFCERSGDGLGDELKGFQMEDDEMVLDNPVRSAAATEVRDAIAHKLLHGSTMAAK